MKLRFSLALAGALVVTASFLPGKARAQDISLKVADSVVRIIPRADLPRDRSIRTRSGEVALLLTDNDVVMQLTDAGLDHVKRETRDSNESVGAFGRIVGAMVRAGVVEMLDRGIAFPLDRLEEARVDDNHLRLIDRNGGKVFADVSINDEKPMESFSRADANSFAKKVNRAIQARRAR